jgi:hypothetical protein
MIKQLIAIPRVTPAEKPVVPAVVPAVASAIPAKDICVKPFNLSRFTSRPYGSMPNSNPARMMSWGRNVK